MRAGIVFGFAGNANVTDQTYDYDARSLEYFSEVEVYSELLSETKRRNIDTLIKELKAESLYDTQWDTLCICRGDGTNAGIHNLIKNSIHGLKIGATGFTENVGYNSNGSSTGINTKFKAATHGVLFTRDDATYLTKWGVVGSGNNQFSGVLTTGGTSIKFVGGFSDYVTINGTLTPYTPAISGYNAYVRTGSNSGKVLQNSDEIAITGASQVLTDLEAYLLVLNNGGIAQFYNVSGTKVELYGYGKSITQAKFLQFQTIVESYFTRLGTKPVYVSSRINSNNLNQVIIEFNVNISSIEVPNKSLFTLTGKTITNTSVSSKYVTLTVSEPFIGGETCRVTYTKPSTKVNYIANEGGTLCESFDQLILDTAGEYPLVLKSQTLGEYDTLWYKFGTYVTKNSINEVTAWADENGSDVDLTTVDPYVPSYDSERNTIVFNGRNAMLQSGSITLNRPTEIYIAAKIINFNNARTIVDGKTADSGRIWILGSDNEANSFSMYAGTRDGHYENTPIFSRANKWNIYKVLFSETSGYIQYNDVAKEVFTMDTDMGGITLGCGASKITSNSICAEISEVICRKKPFTTDEAILVNNYLKSNYIQSQAADIVNINIVTEGHSFISLGSHFATEVVRTVNTIDGSIKNQGVDGNWISSIVSRAAAADAFLKTETATFKNVMVLYMGCNDLYGHLTPQQAYDEFSAYVSARSAAGWKVITFTATPSLYLSTTYPSFEQNRLDFNTLLRAGIPSITNAYLLDTETVTDLANQNSAAFMDGLHPSFYGATLLRDMYLSKLTELYTTKVLNI
jgi:lysophospholipase L1-like esterase